MAVVVLPTTGTGNWGVTLVRKSRDGRTVKKATTRVGSRAVARLLAANFRDDSRTVAVKVESL